MSSTVGGVSFPSPSENASGAWLTSSRKHTEVRLTRSAAGHTLETQVIEQEGDRRRSMTPRKSWVTSISRSCSPDSSTSGSCRRTVMNNATNSSTPRTNKSRTIVCECQSQACSPSPMHMTRRGSQGICSGESTKSGVQMLHGGVTKGGGNSGSGGESCVLYAEDRGIATITLNRPKVSCPSLAIRAKNRHYLQQVSASAEHHARQIYTHRTVVRRCSLSVCSLP